MSNDLLTQLAEYGAYHRDEQGPIRLDDVVSEYPIGAQRGDVVSLEADRQLRRRTGAVALAATAVVAVVTASIWLARDRDLEQEPVGRPDAPTEIGDPVLARRITVVGELMAAYNERRIDDYVSYFAEDGAVVGPAYQRVWGSPTDRDVVAALMAGGDRMLADPRECDPEFLALVGLAPPEVAEGELVCMMSHGDEFHSPRGYPTDTLPESYWSSQIILSFDETEMIEGIRIGSLWEWDRGLTDADAVARAEQIVDYRERFLAWLSDTHPDVADGFGPGVLGALPGADDMGTAVEYIGEFLESEYPAADAARLDTLARRQAAVEAMTEAYGAGDVDAWLGHFRSGAPEIGAGGLAIMAEDGAMAANATWVLTGPCECGELSVISAVSGQFDESHPYLVCPMARRDDFYGAGGIDRRMQFEFDFEGDQLVGYEPTGGDASWLALHGGWFGAHEVFAADFREWLEVAHPADAARLGSRGMITAEEMPIALAHVEEFVAQSDLYPLSDGWGPPPLGSRPTLSGASRSAALTDPTPGGGAGVEDP